MSDFRLIQVSDTHLSRTRPFFVDNWDLVVAHINQVRPDMVLNTGDISLNGADDEDDLAYAAELHREIDCPVYAIPGNHDLGDNPALSGQGAKQPVTPARRDVYRRHFGDDFWMVAAADWQFIGLNAQLFDSGLDIEEPQWLFLQEALEAAGDRPTAVFIHKPLFFVDPLESDQAAHRFVPEVGRRRFMDLIAGSRVKLIACGHVHQYRSHRHGSIDHVWAPSTAFILPEAMQPTYGERSVGFTEYSFNGDDVSFRYVRLDGLEDILLTDVAAYGTPEELRRALAGD